METLSALPALNTSEWPALSHDFVNHHEGQRDAAGENNHHSGRASFDGSGVVLCKPAVLIAGSTPFLFLMNRHLTAPFAIGTYLPAPAAHGQALPFAGGI